jgi:hypothetical protein
MGQYQAKPMTWGHWLRDTAWGVLGVAFLGPCWLGFFVGLAKWDPPAVREAAKQADDTADIPNPFTEENLLPKGVDPYEEYLEFKRRQEVNDATTD